MYLMLVYITFTSPNFVGPSLAADKKKISKAKLAVAQGFILND